MSHFLDALQYRVKTRSMYGWNNSAVIENAWKDIPDRQREFPADVEFRAKPIRGYEVEPGNKEATLYTTKAQMQEAIDAALDSGTIATVAIKMIPGVVPKDIQVYSEHLAREDVTSQFVWQAVTAPTFGTGIFSYGVPVTFRQRPDTYYVLKFNDEGVITGARHTFDDSVIMSKFIDSKLRTDCAGFSVSKVKY